MVGVDVFVGVGEGPAVGVAVGSGVLVGVGVGPAVGVAVGMGVLVGVGPATKVNTSSGGEPPSRESNLTPLLLSGRNTKLYVPLPVIWDVRSYSVQVPAVIASTLSITPVVGAGRLFQVIPFSVQLLSVP